MKISIVFHSVCGNTWLMARAFADTFMASGHNVILRRTVDVDWVEKPGLTATAQSVLLAMRRVPEACPECLLDADLILMGSPVYFGNVSGEMKTFMDQTGALWFKGLLTGKKFAAFVSAGNSEGGGDLALSALRVYAAYMGMVVLPFPVNILPGESSNALGLLQYSRSQVLEKLDEKTSRSIVSWAHFLVAT